MIGESHTSLRVLTWIVYPRNMLSPGSCPCLWEDTRGFWRSMGLTSTYVPFPSIRARMKTAYIHDHDHVQQIMPSAKRATGMFETGRTSSYHIKSVVACQQSAKSSSTFKLVVHRDGGTKRYDFEAENPKVASEIVQNVRSIKNAVERSATFSKSRRSKQVI